ncbi:uncharacterized protein LOC102615044 isoform X3 [Citrus sinensis]|uniref:uncharacterized protein LOC102615044 isoform X3 n=1 Tax=Citrus sinensis TaxID=2711 RepID=UPI002279C54B|nr:uncharacterized protein LOC102615044 isoform X3 [Citrus sinensis]
MGCPSNGIRYNGSLCACPPGQLYNGTSKSCVLFGERSLISTDAGIDYYGVSFPETLFAYDSIKKFSQSQAVFLEATLVMLLSWLVCCFFLRFTKLGDGRTIWFRLRWWISRLDICYATRHWLDDQKVVMKRKTELGGTFSIASWMLFIGLFAALLYQIISKRTIEVHNFVDIPNNPAIAVGFRFNVTAKTNARKKHLSFVSGTLKNASTSDDRPVTFRGKDANILKFNLFPRLYHSLNNLRLLQPLFHEFLPGSFFRETNTLQASLQNSNDGLINTTLLINYLSAYVVEIENRSIIGPVSFVADLGGLYCFSIGIFFYLLVQCEYRIKKLRTEDSILRAIKNRRKAQDRWDKLRKYVTYTWGCKTLHDDYNNAKDGSACCNLRVPSLHHNGSLRKSVSSQKGRQRSSLDSISFNKKVTSSSEKRATREGTHTLDEESVVAGATSNTEGRLSNSRGEPKQNPEMLGVANTGKKHFHHPDVGVAIKPQAFSHGDDYIIPPPPPLGITFLDYCTHGYIVLKDDSEIEMSDIQKNFQSLYDYNMTLRDKLVATQSSLRALAAMSTSPVSESQTQT